MSTCTEYARVAEALVHVLIADAASPTSFAHTTVVVYEIYAWGSILAWEAEALVDFWKTNMFEKLSNHNERGHDPPPLFIFFLLSVPYDPLYSPLSLL